MLNKVRRRKLLVRDGMTLVEVIVTVAIFSIILGAAGRFILYSLSSWKQIQTTSNTISSVNNVLVVMEKEVRQARIPTYAQNSVNVFAGLDGTEIIEAGSRVDIYTDFHSELLRITYLVYDDAFWRIETDLSADPPTSTEDLEGLVPQIPFVRNCEDINGDIIPIFSITSDKKQLTIRFEALDPNGQEENLFEVNTSYTVRPQGVM